MLSFIIKYYVEIILSLVVTLITHLYHNINKYIKKINVLEKQACINIKIHIIDKYEIINKRGFITVDEKEELLNLYNIYKDLNCNNVTEELVQNLDKIQIK